MHLNRKNISSVTHFLFAKVFAKEINKQMDRCGQRCRDRFKSSALQNDQELVHLMIYHDLNEVRAGKVKHPKHNTLSSYAHYAFGKEDLLLTDPETYLNLGSSPKERLLSYQGMVEEILIAAPKKEKLNPFYHFSLFSNSKYLL